jgi:hypothetical protein
MSSRSGDRETADVGVYGIWISESDICQEKFKLGIKIQNNIMIDRFVPDF